MMYFNMTSLSGKINAKTNVKHAFQEERNVLGNKRSHCAAVLRGMKEVERVHWLLNYSIVCVSLLKRKFHR